MKRTLIALLLGIIFPHLLAEEAFVLNSVSRTLSRLDLSLGTVDNSFAQLGTTPNRMEILGNHMYVVCSGDNALQKFNLTTGALESTIFIANSCNPWDLVIDQDYAYVTGLFTNKVYRINLLTEQVAGSLEVGVGPEGLCVADNKLYVANTGNYPNYNPSTVSIIDLTDFSLIRNLPVDTNPQYLAYADGRIFVACTGNWSTITGKVDVINPQTNEVETVLTIGGTLGNIWAGPYHRAYIAEAMNTASYRIDTLNLTVLNDAPNPFQPLGSCVWGNANFIGFVDAQWGQNGVVRITNHIGTVLHEYTVGLSPTDIKFTTGTVANDDLAASAPLPIEVYPNPNTGTAHFKSTARSKSQVELFDVKGRMVATLPLDTAELTWHAPASGIYLYRLVEQGRTLRTGKLTVVK